jgi:sodium pump decarboxylase gamma subunit
MVKAEFDATQMTTSEIWANGIMVTIIGFVLVIAVLLIIALILTLFGKVMTAQEKRKKSSSEVAKERLSEAVAPVVPAVQPVAEQSENLADDLELVAVITAAIAASTGTSPDKLVVKSLRSRKNRRRAWSNEAINEQLQSNSLYL